MHSFTAQGIGGFYYSTKLRGEYAPDEDRHQWE